MEASPAELIIREYEEVRVYITVKGDDNNPVQGDIVIFAGLVENSHDAKTYKAEILFSNSK